MATVLCSIVIFNDAIDGLDGIEDRIGVVEQADCYSKSLAGDEFPSLEVCRCDCLCNGDWRYA
jgi:hypothetical protein